LPSEDEFEYDDNGDDTVTIVNYIGNETDVTIPQQIAGLTVTKIGESAFENKNLSSVTIPGSITHIETSAFANNKLINVTLKNGIERIEVWAFRNNDLTNIIIPISVTYIGPSAF